MSNQTKHPYDQYIEMFLPKHSQIMVVIKRGFAKHLQEDLQSKPSKSSSNPSTFSIPNPITYLTQQGKLSPQLHPDLMPKMITLEFENYALPMFYPTWVSKFPMLSQIKIGFNVPIPTLKESVTSPLYRVCENRYDICEQYSFLGKDQATLFRMQDIFDIESLLEDLGEEGSQMFICYKKSSLTKRFANSSLDSLLKDLEYDSQYCVQSKETIQSLYRDLTMSTPLSCKDILTIVKPSRNEAESLIEAIGNDTYTIRQLVSIVPDEFLTRLSQFMLERYEERDKIARKEKFEEQYGEHREFIEKVRKITESEEGGFLE